MSTITTENTFETAIVQSLIDNGGYSAGNAPDYSPELGLFKYDVLNFLRQLTKRHFNIKIIMLRHGLQ